MPWPFLCDAKIPRTTKTHWKIPSFEQLMALVLQDSERKGYFGMPNKQTDLRSNCTETHVKLNWQSALVFLMVKLPIG